MQHSSKIKTSAFSYHRRLAKRHGCCCDDILLARIGNLSGSEPADVYASAEQLQYRQGFAIQPWGGTDGYRKLAMCRCRLCPAQRCIDDPEQAGCALDKIAAQIAKVVRGRDSSENDDCRAMHPGQQSTWTAELCFKIIETFQQPNDEFAAGGEIGSTGGVFGSQPLQLSDNVSIRTVHPDVCGGRQRTQQSLHNRLGQDSVPKHPD